MKILRIGLVVCTVILWFISGALCGLGTYYTGTNNMVQVQPYFIPACAVFTLGVILLYFAAFYKAEKYQVRI